MKCPNCGAELEQGKIYCEHCGHEIQIVPDYDPLVDEVLIGREDGTEKTSEQQEAKEAEPEKSEKKPGQIREKHRKKGLRGWQKCALILAGVLVCVGVSYMSYSSMTSDNSYAYQLRKGKRYEKKQEYEKAILYLRRAEELQRDMGGTDTEPLCLLAETYAKVGAKEQALFYMREAISLEEETRGDTDHLRDLYLELMNVLNETGRTGEIEAVIANCPYESIRKELLPYRVTKPSCDTPEGTYGYYLRLNLTAEYGSIYYTLDGTVPTEESTRYEEPIELNEEGEVLLCAVAVNKKGMRSEPLVLVYKLDFPVADPNAVDEE